MVYQKNATVVIVQVIVHNGDHQAETERGKMTQTGTGIDREIEVVMILITIEVGTGRKVEAERGMIMKGRKEETETGEDG